MKVTDLIRKAAKKLETPFLVLDIEQVKKNYLRLKDSMKNVEIFYAVKANSHIEILKVLRDLGSSFDVASVGEINKLLSLGISPKKMSFGNPIKKEKDIAYAWEVGIEYFSVDSEMEVEKVARNAPGSKVYARIATSSSDSDWPLSGKFGTDIDHVISILNWANRHGLKPFGVSFHVGSQSYNKYKWQEAILESSVVFNKLLKNGIELKMLNLGGGIPVKHTKPIPTVEEIGEVVEDSIREYLWKHKNLMIVSEPGRSMVGDAGILVSRVILKSRKGSKKWIYLDVGVFHGLMETIENFQYEIQVEGKNHGNKDVFTIAGPTCDSVDTIYEDTLLPSDIDYNDIVYFINSGAYTVEYSSYFNGIEPPKVYTLDELKEILKD